MTLYHTPVLINEVIEALNVSKGRKYIDATLGGGGHTERIIDAGGKVLGIDADQDAIEHVREKFQISNFKFQIGKELTLVQGNFRDIKSIAEKNGFEKVAGILFDVGVSSHQLDTKARGFSFQSDAPLDMRMDQNLAVKAADLINGLTEDELYELFTKLGEEPMARPISKAIIKSRRIKPIATTQELVQIVAAVKRRDGHIHPATQVFQALRIAVNSELENLREGLSAGLQLLETKGRLVVISFHSLEDRIVKNQFKNFEEKKMGRIITKKPIIPSNREIEDNPRARSSKLRIFERK